MVRATPDLEKQSNTITSILKVVQQKGWALGGKNGDSRITKMHGCF